MQLTFATYSRPQSGSDSIMKLHYELPDALPQARIVGSLDGAQWYEGHAADFDSHCDSVLSGQPSWWATILNPQLAASVSQRLSSLTTAEINLVRASFLTLRHLLPYREVRNPDTWQQVLQDQLIIHRAPVIGPRSSIYYIPTSWAHERPSPVVLLHRWGRLQKLSIGLAQTLDFYFTPLAIPIVPISDQSGSAAAAAMAMWNEIRQRIQARIPR